MILIAGTLKLGPLMLGNLYFTYAAKTSWGRMIGGRAGSVFDLVRALLGPVSSGGSFLTLLRPGGVLF